MIIKLNKIGIVGEEVTSWIFWIILIALGLAIVYFLIKRFSGL